MLRPYTGELFISPVATHLGLNWCSAACFYCYANNNDPQRRVNSRVAMNTLRVAASGEPSKNIAANLLRAGHRILCSNDSDPFAVSNAEAFQQIYNFARERGYLFAFQTRGGKDAIKTLEEHPPTFCYISLTSDKDDRIRFAEPGAPLHGARMELIAAAKAAGHNVVAGVNPYRPEWWQDQERLVRDLADLGVKHSWTGMLHMSYQQRDNLPMARRERHAEEITYAMKRHKPDLDGLIALDNELVAAGINVFSGGRSKQGHFWDEYSSMAQATMPTLESLFDHFTAVSGGKRVVFSLSWFSDWAERLPDVSTSAFKEYLNSFGRTLRNRGEATKAWNFRDVCAAHWRVMELPTIFDRWEFAVAIQGDSDDAPVLTDDDGNPLLVWKPEPNLEPCEPVDDSDEGDDALWLV